MNSDWIVICIGAGLGVALGFIPFLAQSLNNYGRGGPL